MSKKAQLYVGPTGFQLPSLMPEAIVIETALRLTMAHFDVLHTEQSLLDNKVATINSTELHKVKTAASRCCPAYSNLSAPVPCPVLVVPDTKDNGASSSSSQQKHSISVGAEEILKAIQLSSTTRLLRLTDGLTAAQQAQTEAMVALIRQTVFPAFEYLMNASDNNFNMVSGKLHNNQSFTSRLWASVSSQRQGVLKRLQCTHPELRSESDAVSLLEKGLLAVERSLAGAGMTIGSSGASSAEHENPRYFFGLSHATLIDCYLFAAVTLCASTRFHAGCALAAFQTEKLSGGVFREGGAASEVEARAREEGGASSTTNNKPSAFPLSQHYARLFALQHYESYAGLHYLGIPATVKPSVGAEEGDDDVYRPGRKWTLVGTAAFASMYFVVVNAPLWLALLQALTEDDGGQPELPMELTGGHGHGDAMMMQQGGEDHQQQQQQQQQ